MSQEAGGVTTVRSPELGMAVRDFGVPWARRSALAARRIVVSGLKALEVDTALVDEVEIVISELVANAFRHAKALPDGTIRVSWSVTDAGVEVAVTDGGGATTPRPAPHSLSSPHGRGLRIVRSLASEWGTEDRGDTHTVWVRLAGSSGRGGLGSAARRTRVGEHGQGIQTSHGRQRELGQETHQGSVSRTPSLRGPTL